MQVDSYGQIILSENDLCEILLKNPNANLAGVITKDNLPKQSFIAEMPKINLYEELNISIEEFDSNQQNNWKMPEQYKNMDIAKYVLDQCKNEAELQRAGEELIIFQEKNMFTLLQYLKYLVDTMRQHNIIWGVGRGSSVASFVLFLIGVHKINSLYYDLDISEFIK
jgi:DNA polymerase III alpha subunit